MSEMLDQLTDSFNKSKGRNKKRADYSAQLARVFKKGKIKKIVPFF